MTSEGAAIPQKVSGGTPREREGREIASRRLALVLAVTALFAGLEVVGGIISQSLALIADSAHMGTDVAALALALIGSRIALRRDGSTRRFGNLRWEILAAMVNGLALFVIAMLITVEAIDRFRHPRPIDAVILGWVAFGGLLVNIFSLKVLHGHHHEDLNARGAYLHIAGDLLGSLGAITGALLIIWTGKLWFDPLISVLVSLLILRSAWRLVRESGMILLDRVPLAVEISQVEARLLAVPGVVRVHDLHVWAVTSDLVAMSTHAVVPDLAHHPEVLRLLEAEMVNLGIQHVTIQLETEAGCLAGDCDEIVIGGTSKVGHVH